jgi:diguanylate cyclase (GGDEF)-like protein
VVNLGGKILMLSCQPVLPKHGESGPQGTLIMARELDQEVVSTISRSAGFPVWIEPTATLPVVDGREIAWSDGKTSAVIGSDSTMLYYVGLPDLSGKPAMLLAARTPRSLYLESKTETRYLWTLLTLAGIVYCGMLFWFVDHVLVARIDRLSNDISKVTVSGDLSVRLSAVGKDELSSLARTLNSMFAAIQKAKSELLQAQESLRFHAEHDALTGVLNRRAVRDVLRKELSRCRREQNTLGVILVDVDHFKKINDHKGHAAGDAVLVTVVQRITSMLRTYDTLGRYGGEEFLIVAPGCDLTVAQRLAERIRTIISDEPVDLGDGTINVTVSMGVTLGTAESDPEFLVAQADTAMYKAKRNGRNRFEVGLDLPEDEDEAIEIQPR